MAAQGRPLPEYVQREFEDYLKCGRLEHGFLRVRCTSCHQEQLVAFSCKRRRFCPSCGARRMAESAALLVDDALNLTLFALVAMLFSLGVMPIAVNRVTEPCIERAVPVRLVQLLRISPLGAVGALSAGAVNGAFWGMAPVFGQRLMLGEGQIALLMGATIFGGAMLQWPIGHISDRIDRRSVLIMVSFATAIAAGIAAWIVVNGYPGLAFSAFVYGGLMFFLYAISVAHTNDHLE
jgi:ribosomal protein S27E